MDSNLLYRRTVGALRERTGFNIYNNNIERLEDLDIFFLITDEAFNMLIGSQEVRNLWHLDGLRKEIASFDIEDKSKIIEVKMDEKGVRNFKIYKKEFIDYTGEKCFVFYGVDITDVISQKKKAEEVNRIKSEFLANISHEIRTSLVGILGFCEIMENRSGLLIQKESIETIHYCAKQLLGLVNDVLDLSRIEAGQVTIRQERFNLFRLIKKTAFAFQPRIEEKGLAFCLLIDERIPEEVIGDEVRLRQILNNLLLNAVQYTDEGYVKLEVVLEEEGKVGFKVYDTGRGIKENDVELVFRPFVRLAVAERESTGSGLGLAITKQMVELMGGNIWYKPNGDKGSIFGFSLPLKRVEEGKGMTEQEKDDISKSLYNLSSARQVLLVEDIAVNRKLISYMLKNLGYEVIDAENGKRCLEILQEKRPDVILLDMQMPVMDGYQTVRIIRQTEGIRDIPVVALTAYAMEGDGEKCLEAGCDYYLSKPFTQEQLKKVIEVCLSDRL